MILCLMLIYSESVQEEFDMLLVVVKFMGSTKAG